MRETRMKARDCSRQGRQGRERRNETDVSTLCIKPECGNFGVRGRVRGEVRGRVRSGVRPQVDSPSDVLGGGVR